MSEAKLIAAEELRDHARANLEEFIKDESFFKTKEDRKHAEEIYIKLISAEKELKQDFKDKYNVPSFSDSLKFGKEIFKKETKDNVLTRAIYGNFSKTPAVKLAAWEYYTLQTSKETLTKLKPKNIRDGRFDANKQTDSTKEDNKEAPKGKNKSVVNVGREGTPVEGKDAGPSEGASSQAATEDVETTEEHIIHAHNLGIFPGMSRSESPLSDDDKDDSKRVIFDLMCAHQDYFDQKALSRAQAEYHFYRVLEHQWKKTEKRVQLEEIKYKKFNMKMFYDLPKIRPLYAVILTILEQSKDKKRAEAAAEEYYRLSVLEKAMFEQKIINAIPQGLDLDSAHFNDLYRDMKTRFRSSGSQAQMRQPAEFKMVPLFEYLKMKETITQQRKQIEELAGRLSGIASQQLAEGDAGFTDLGDKNRPQKLGERFAELFDETWSSAYESLRPKREGEEEESDEKTMDILQSVVKAIYEFCLKVSQEQIERIVGGMIPPIVDPMNTAEETEIPKPADVVRTKTEHMAKEYRKVVAPATIKVLQKEIYEKELKGKLLHEPIGTEVEKYVSQCVDLIWYMCIQQPAMEIVWAKTGEKFNREQFRFSGKKGKTYKLTVWPAVFLHKDGPLVAPGYAVPE